MFDNLINIVENHYSINMDFTQTTNQNQTHANKFSQVCQHLTDMTHMRSALNPIGLHPNTISWEDTDRAVGSCVGDNITDITLGAKNPETGTVHNMLFVKRSTNFEDLTYHLPLSQFAVSVGNEKGQELQKVSLVDYLSNITGFTGAELKKRTDGLPDTLFLPEENVLVSSQICVLPLQNGSVDFCVSAMNYQGAVLYIVIGPNGTSTYLDSGDYDMQPLYFNDNGKACFFSAERLQAVRAQAGIIGEESNSEVTAEEKEKGQFVIIQIPLVRKIAPRQYYLESCSFGNEECCMQSCLLSMDDNEELGFDSAVISTGSDAGKEFPQITELLTRDFSKKIRATYQHYCVTDSADITDDVKDTFLRTLIEDVEGKQVGSFVTQTGNKDHLTAFTQALVQSVQLTKPVDFLPASTQML